MHIVHGGKIFVDSWGGGGGVEKLIHKKTTREFNLVRGATVQFLTTMYYWIITSSSSSAGYCLKRSYEHVITNIKTREFKLKNRRRKICAMQ